MSLALALMQQVLGLGLEGGPWPWMLGITMYLTQTDYMKLAPFRSCSDGKGYHYSTRMGTYLMNAWADDDATANYETSWM